MIRSVLTTVTASVALAVLAAGCGGPPADEGPRADERTERDDKPTVVLVHGAFADSSSWNAVVSLLETSGYPVIAAANPLRGLASDAQYVRGLLDSVSGPVVLAGHSYGGSVMTEAADGSPNVKALVYIASFILDRGESTGALAAKFPGAELGPALHTVRVPLPGGGFGDDNYIRQEEFRRVFAADVPPDVTAQMAATQRPITTAALEEPATKTPWKTIPSWNLITARDLAIPAESMRFMGQRANATDVEIDASHAVTVSRPDAVADLIEQAATAIQN